MSLVKLDSIEEIVKDSETLKNVENKRTFEYNMNDKSAKAKLVKGAKREAYEVVKNQSSCNLDFSVGSWNHIVLPTIQYLNNIRGEKTCTVGTLEVKVASVKTGKDIIGKHIDTQIVFYSNRDKIVCHFHNTTQRILVNGHGYMKFVEEFLSPFFESKLSTYETEIKDFNNLVLDTLGNRMVKRSDIKYKRGSTFDCIKCGFAAKTSSTLEKHLKTEHALRFESASSSSFILKKPVTSTRDNSFNGILGED